MPSKEKIKQITFKIENNIFLTIIRNGLTMMIPLVLIGGIACALINLPFINYDSLSPFFKQLHIVLDAIYQGTFGLFSLALVIALSLCYGMENNETTDKVGLYIIVALGSYSSQLHIASEHFNFEALGAKGSFSAIFITMFSCFCYDKIKRITIFSLKKYSLGMNVICTHNFNLIHLASKTGKRRSLFTHVFHTLFKHTSKLHLIVVIAMTTNVHFPEFFIWDGHVITC